MKKMFNVLLLSLLTVGVTTANSNPNQKLKVDASKSTIQWVGKKVSGSHTGKINIKSGELQTTNGKIVSGQFDIDMNSITCDDVKGEYGDKFVGHLKSDDFFGSANFPISTLKITNVNSKGNNSYGITADLTIKGFTQSIHFDATVNLESKIAEAKIIIDRTKFGIKYGSGSFFDKLGDKTIDNNFELNATLALQEVMETPSASKKMTKKLKK
ncbi:MAG: YceI family protein [Bacteroidota bacterium]|nr:YceI family protein [Bacteroidota bacterium]